MIHVFQVFLILFFTSSCSSLDDFFGTFFYLTLRVLGLKEGNEIPERPISQAKSLADFDLREDFWPVSDLKSFRLTNWSSLDLQNRLKFNLSDPEVKKALKRLNESIVGTRREKRAVKQFCEKKAPRFQPGDPIALSCLIYLIETYPQKNSPSQKSLALFQDRSVAKFKWSQLKEVSVQSSLKAFPLKKLSQLEQLGKDALEEKDKKLYVGAAIALILKGEVFFPDQKAISIVDQIYEAYQDFFKFLPVFEERIHVRMGVLYLYVSKVMDDSEFFLKKAAQSFEFALQSAPAKERDMALFWLGYLNGVYDEEKGYFFPKNSYWKRLIFDHPFSFHSMIAAHLLKLDYFESVFSRQSDLFFSPFLGNQFDENQDNLINYTALVLHTAGLNRAIAEFERLALSAHTGAHLPLTLFLAVFFHEQDRLRVSFRLFEKAIQNYGVLVFNEALLQYLHPKRYEKLIEKYTSDFQTYLVLALARQESSFDPAALSPVGAKGVMQLMPSTARHLSAGRRLNLYKPDVNIRLGTTYLKKRLSNLEGDYVKSTAAYNAGILRIRDWETRFKKTKFNLLFMDLIPFLETRHYPPKILTSAVWYGYFDSLKQGQENFEHVSERLVRYQDLPLGKTPVIKLEGPFRKNLEESTSS